MTPDPTDAELDGLERLAKEWDVIPRSKGQRLDLLDIIQALRACHQRSKAKDALLAEIREHCKKGVFQGIKAICATLDSEAGLGIRPREPTEEMIHAGRFPVSMSVTERWQAMWDAAKSNG